MREPRTAPMVSISSILLLFLLIAAIPSSAFAANPGESSEDGAPSGREYRFGAVEAYTAATRAREAGVSWERVIFRWDQYQPKSPADSDWRGNQWFTESDLKLEMAEGRQVVGVVLGTPRWLTGDDPRVPPPNLDLPFDHPDNYWGQFMRRLAAQYAGRVDSWIIWNEPDVWNNDGGLQQWSGSVESYYQLLKVAYQAVKSVNPKGRIILAGLTYWWDQQFGREQYFQRLLRVASQDPTAKANGFYFDVAALHLYSNPWDLYNVPRLYKQIMQQYGLDKPIWINETNAVPYDDAGVKLGRGGYRASMDEQASYLIQAFAMGLAAGVDRISVYKMQDDFGRPGAEPYGLVRSDPGESTRASYEAYQVITRYMSQAKSARLYRQGPAAAVKLERPGDWVTVAWNLTPAQTQIALPARASGAALVDKFGHTRPVLPKDGKYFLDLPGAVDNASPGAATQSHIGGSPLLLVEEKRLAIPAAAPSQDWSAPGVDPGQSWVSPVTGYSVSGEWLKYFQGVGGAEVLGHPLGNVRPDPADGRQIVQYFQRGILEWHPENPPEYRIQRRLLGNLLYPGYDAPVNPEDPRQRPLGEATFFPNTLGAGLGHYVANAAPDGSPTHFKEFFDKHGGTESFGYPKEEPKLRNGRWTQRFQAGVLEYHPEAVQGGSSAALEALVQLEPLGEKALRDLELPLDW